MEEKLIEHIISIGNPVLGVFRYLVLQLPEGWIVKSSEIPPEISYTTEYNGIGYVVDGLSHNYITSVLGEEMLQLTIKCSKIRGELSISTRGLENYSLGRTHIANHPCLYVYGEKPVGFLRKERMRYLAMVFDCSFTGRRIELRLLGKQSSGVIIEGLIPALEQSRCHG
ncbi:MAG TPA: hypothetical protein EYH45_07460 [Candidatus Caldiarchaeum subterraneum]|uniref:Uncharacterized protein n=1 Tax=Caldiarchaeum subterraneum TaxID=311458 RepID=A0A832ZXJ3_CALS0|nr:hypothetical protein [Candidatus Caldarchaeum subterraneum]